MVSNELLPGIIRKLDEELPERVTTTGGSPQPGQQKVQIVKTTDGKMQVRGLMAGQQLVQMPDGRLQIFTSNSTSKLTSPTTTQAEVQQLNLLGREWKERELEREERMQRKLEEVAAMKQELQESLAELDKERTAVKQREQELAREKGQVEEEGRKVKEERGGLLDKLKAKLRTVESELEAKTGELSGLREKVRAGEAEISRLRVVAGGKKQQERGTGQGVSVEAARLKSENQLLKSELLAVEADRDRAVTALASANQQLSSWQLQGQERQEKKVQQLEETVVGLQQEISRIRKSPSNSSTPRKLQPKMELDEIIEVERVDKVVKMVELVEERSDSDGSGASGGLSSIASGKQKRIRGLERDRDTLLRTGNYSHDDYIVRAMQEKIDKLKEKPDGL